MSKVDQHPLYEVTPSQNSGLDEFLRWAQTQLGIPHLKIEDFFSGEHFCALIHSLHHDSIDMNKVIPNASTRSKITDNYTLLDEAIRNVGINRSIDPPSMLRDQYSKTLELLQWFYGYSHFLAAGGIPQFAGGAVNNRNNGSSTDSNDDTITREEKYKRKQRHIKKRIDTAELEEEFYKEKLLRIADYIHNHPCGDISERIQSLISEA